MLDNRIFEEGASIPLNSDHTNKRVRRNTKNTVHLHALFQVRFVKEIKNACQSYYNVD